MHVSCSASEQSFGFDYPSAAGVHVRRDVLPQHVGTIAGEFGKLAELNPEDVDVSYKPDDRMLRHHRWPASGRVWTGS